MARMVTAVLTAVPIDGPAAGEEVVLERQADLHHLQLDRLERLHALEGHRRLLANRALLHHDDTVDHEEQHKDDDNRSEAQIQFPADSHSVYFGGSNLNATDSFVSFFPGSNFHFFIAISAAEATTALPPSVFRLLTVPAGATTSSNITAPARPAPFANKGYPG